MRTATIVYMNATLAGWLDSRPRPGRLRRHAFPGKGPAAAAICLARAATEGNEREEHFETEAGTKLTATVQPLKHGEAAWWFTPRLVQSPS